MECSSGTVQLLASALREEFNGELLDWSVRRSRLYTLEGRQDLINLGCRHRLCLELLARVESLDAAGLMTVPLAPQGDTVNVIRRLRLKHAGSVVSGGMYGDHRALFTALGGNSRSIPDR